ncbi:MAG: arabinofuranosidase catalytic domain-containing protein, partial [Acidobacteriota bacterium]
YDPMRKQGAILLGNGGDNSNGSQGTFYEGAVTAAGTFPSDATDQQVQANIVAAHYAMQPVSLAPASATATPPGLQTFSPGASQNIAVTFTNTTGAPAADVTLSLSVPSPQWTSSVEGTTETSKSFAGPVAPGASVSAVFQVTSGSEAFNGDLAAQAQWTDPANGRKQSDTAVEKVRNVSPVRINEFRISSGPPTNSTDSFIELYNAGAQSVDLSNWTLTEHPTQHAISSAITIPAGTSLAAGGFYLLGLSNSGLAAPAHAGDTTVYVRSTTGMKAGDSIVIGAGAQAETRKIATLGTAASDNTTLWQPLPDGPVITIPAGSSNVPVTSVAGFAVGQKIALGYGAAYPTVANTREKYEVATVTAVGKPGTQAYLAADAPAGSTNLKVTSLADISAGDKIRLDIDSLGHGIETVTVKSVGTQGTRTNLAADASAGATQIRVRGAQGFAVGNKIDLGTPANREVVTVTAIGPPSREGAGIEISPALAQAHIRDETVTDPGTGLELEAPLKFNHAANLPFSDRGTGIGFEPATAFAHSSDEPVQALGAGITLDSPLNNNHEVDAVVRDAADTAAGYQGTPAPNQWFGGPALSTSLVMFGRYTITENAGSMVLRDAAGLVVDSLNYGGLVDPWAAQGYQAASGAGKSGCFVKAPGEAGGFGPAAMRAGASNTSAGRFPDGADTGSNCADFLTAPSTILMAAADAGATNLKVASVTEFDAGQTIRIGSGANLDTAVIATVGTAGATTVKAATAAGATVVPVAGIAGFSPHQTITIGSGASQEQAEVAGVDRRDSTLTVAAPLTHAHAAGEPAAGTGITLAAPLAHAHRSEAQVAGSPSTPGAPNHYFRKPR